MSDVRSLTAEEFEEVLGKTPVLLVDFYADWCMPCKMMAPVVEKAAALFEGKLTVAKVNVDEAPELAERYGIQSIPALLMFKDGEVAKALIGLRPYEELASTLESLF